MDKITVKPAGTDLIVPNPENHCKPLSQDGETVHNVRYWQRRIKDGEVVQIKKPIQRPTKTEDKSKKS